MYDRARFYVLTLISIERSQNNVKLRPEKVFKSILFKYFYEHNYHGGVIDILQLYNNITKTNRYDQINVIFIGNRARLQARVSQYSVKLR